MLTMTKEAISYREGEVEWYYADFDPPTMRASQSLLDGRTIASATASIVDDLAGNVTNVAVVSGGGETVNGVLIEAGTGVKFKVSGLETRDGYQETIVNVLATLSDGSVKPLGVRFMVEA